MKTEQILMCVVALVLGMLLANMLKSVSGCKVVEGQSCDACDIYPDNNCAYGWNSGREACINRKACFNRNNCAPETWMAS